MTKPFVTRFAPSPTGRMHAGNIFAYLVAWLMAKQQQGSVLLRIEDLDRGRSRPEYASAILRDLSSLGLTWDGEVLYQSERTSLYQEALRDLGAKSELYPCFCTRADIHSASAPHSGEATVYPRTCYKLSAHERLQKAAELQKDSRTPSLRIHVPEKIISFDDIFQGRQSFNLARECGDFILQRSDGGFAYQLAVVVDDAFQHVNMVVRGCDLLPSTAQQLYLQELLAFAHPHYAHLPLMVDSRGRRIAKRDADASIDELVKAYGSYEGVLGHIAYVGHLIDVDEPARADELIKEAHLAALLKKTHIVWKEDL